jgi:hypothetical protein
VLLNFADEAREVPLPPDVAPPGRWRLVVSTDDCQYCGGAGAAPAVTTTAAGGRTTVPAHAAALYRQDDD